MIIPETTLKMMAQLDDIPLPNAILMLENFIFKMKGKRVAIKLNTNDPEEIRKFETAITLATNYYLSI
jgi:hypothetical protein